MDRTVAELIAKDVDRQHMTDGEHKAFVDYWFSEYERTGFASVFKTPYTDEKKYEGQAFEVLGRCGEDAYDLEVLPVWKIRLECGDELDAYPEEICQLEREVQRGNPAPSAKPLYEQIQAANEKAIVQEVHIEGPWRLSDPEQKSNRLVRNEKEER